MTSPRIPEERNMHDSEIARRRDHLLAEIDRDHSSRFSIPHTSIPHKLIVHKPLAIAAAILLAVLSVATTLMIVGGGDRDTRDPQLLLASARTAVEEANDYVLYAKETEYPVTTITPTTQPQRVLEGWSDRREAGVGRVRELGSGGQLVIDSVATVQDGKLVRQDVLYDTGTVHVSSGRPVSLAPLLPDVATSVLGEEQLGDVLAIHLTGLRDNVPMEIWIDESTNLPVRAWSTRGGKLVLLDYKWIPRTTDSLATFLAPVPVPPSFAVTDAPVDPSRLPDAPGSGLGESPTLEAIPGVSGNGSEGIDALPPPPPSSTTVVPSPITGAPRMTTTTAAAPPTSPPTTSRPAPAPPTTASPTTTAQPPQQPSGSGTFSSKCETVQLSPTQQIRNCVSSGEIGRASSQALKLENGQWVQDNSVFVGIDRVENYVDGRTHGGNAHPSGPQAGFASATTRNTFALDRSQPHTTYGKAVFEIWEGTVREISLRELTSDVATIPPK
jgi:hypothetical protein